MIYAHILFVYIAMLQEEINRLSALLEENKFLEGVKSAIIQSQKNDIIALETELQNHECETDFDFYEPREKPKKVYLN